MVSVENLYWVLYHNLLRPVDLDCWYYYPFGTTQYLSSAGDFKPWKPKNDHHVLFHFDQEPIWTPDLGTLYDAVPVVWSNKLVRILANSEKSDIKKQICRERGMLDWYFFYHGFATLDWFRDSQYIQDQDEISSVFLSLNHLVKHKRSYRMSMTARLINLAHHGQISFHGTAQDCVDEMSDPWCNISHHSRDLIKRNLCSLDHLPLIVDSTHVDGDASARFGHREYAMWQRSLLHVVNETVFYSKKLHLTEKIFKPIVAGRPFVLVAAPGNLAYLRSYGFKTFGNWIDESYDSVQDDDVRMNMIAREVSKLCDNTPIELRSIYQEMKPILDFNKQHFFGEFRRIIINELVDNFDACIRIWNNGRVDDRVWPMHPDLESVKELLSR